MKRPLLGLDWLRGAASIMVCLFHIKKYVWGDAAPYDVLLFFDYGYLGVYIFFVVSGFIIPYSLDRSGYKTGNFTRFIFKRLIRIQPPYLLLLGLLLAWNFGLHEWKGWGTPWLFGWKKFFLNAMYLVPFTEERWIFSIFWTLAVEFQYYLLIGMLFVLLRDRPIFRYLIYCILLALSLTVPRHYQSLPNHAVYFLIGFQTFLLFTGKIHSREFGISLTCMFLFIGLFGLLPTLPPVALATYFILFVHIRNRLAAFFGSVSYSLYLTHGLSGAGTVLLTAGYLSDWGRFGLAVGVSVLFASVYYRVAEKPFLDMSKRITY